MSATLIYEDREPYELAGSSRDPLRLTLDELHAATGWERKPQGLCRGETCIPEATNAGWYDEKSGLFDVGRFAAHLSQPVARDAESAVAAVGVPANDRRMTMESLEAPDFALPDMDGKIHRLSDYRGKKVFLFSWGSY